MVEALLDAGPVGLNWARTAVAALLLADARVDTAAECAIAAPPALLAAMVGSVDLLRVLASHGVLDAALEEDLLRTAAANGRSEVRRGGLEGARGAGGQGGRKGARRREGGVVTGRKGHCGRRELQHRRLGAPDRQAAGAGRGGGREGGAAEGR